MDVELWLPGSCGDWQPQGQIHRHPTFLPIYPISGFALLMLHCSIKVHLHCKQRSAKFPQVNFKTRNMNHICWLIPSKFNCWGFARSVLVLRVVCFILLIHYQSRAKTGVWGKKTCGKWQTAVITEINSSSPDTAALSKLQRLPTLDTTKHSS